MSEDALKTLVKSRGNIKAAITRFAHYFESLPQDCQITQLKVRYDAIKECLSEFKTIQSQIETQESYQGDSEDERGEFEDRYFDLISRVEDFISLRELATVKVSQNCTSSNGNGNAGVDSKVHNIVRLPRINLPSFSGNYHEWTSFHDTFQSLIHNNHDISNIQKFHYLKSSLKGEAEDILQSLDITSANYSQAWELLRERYDNKRLIIQTHIKAICDLPSANKENYIILRQILDGSFKHIRALKSLGRPTDQWDDLLVHLISNKLDQLSNKEWEASLSKDSIPTLKELTDFLVHKCQILEAISKSVVQDTSISKSHNKFSTRSTVSHITTNFSTCPICNKNDHPIYRCEKFLNLSVKNRLQDVKSKNLCINCLKSNHRVNKCSSSNCRKCNKMHNTLLHFNDEINREPSTSKAAPSSTVIAHSANKDVSQIFLSTAIIGIRDGRGKILQCRALLDSGSQSNFITRTLANKLDLKQNNVHIPVVGINNTISQLNKMVSTVITSLHNKFNANIECLILDDISGNLPQFLINKDSIRIPNNIKLADPEFHVPRKIDVLIGADLFWKLLCVGQIKTSSRQPYVQKTQFGWIVSGKFSTDNLLQNTSCNLSLQQLDSSLIKFWELEEIANKRRFTLEEQCCEQHFESTYKRSEDGRFIVQFPLKSDVASLGDSRNAAIKRFYSLERRLDREPNLRAEYNDFISEYLKLGHMKEIASVVSWSNSACFYLPHHCVIKETSLTTRLRVVFDGSAKSSSGVSLNDLMMVGPTIQDDLFSIVSRFRIYNYVFTADITKMYRQILVDTSQTALQRILWRFHHSEDIKTYELLTVTYGTASASYLAIKSLQQLARDEELQYPLGAAVVLNDFYVDDMLSGANTISEARSMIKETSALLLEGGFELRKWASNHQDLLKQLPESQITSQVLDLSKDCSTRTLGLEWNPQTDTLQYTAPATVTSNKITKRIIVSRTAQIFDPLGLIGPVTTKFKILIQELWALKLDWDESIPTQLHSTWNQLENQFHLLNQLIIPRQVTISGESTGIEICGFCDASERAYGACIYIRSTNINGTVQSKLLCAKSKVAPLKTISLPKLELCGALLLARLTKKVETSLKIPINNIHLWSDSTITLGWISSPAKKWKTFVSNRVGEIAELTNLSAWNHTSTLDNPADLLSRGSTPAQLLDQTFWWTGPDWLSKPQNFWPRKHVALQINNLPESRKETVSLVTCWSTSLELINKFSSFNKLVRITAYCLRFVRNAQAKCTKSSTNITNGPLRPDELSRTILCLIKVVQATTFARETSDLQIHGKVNSQSKLLCLNPFLDNEGIIRVGGRLRNSHLPYNSKHPIALPPNHALTKLIVSSEHRKHLHAGPQATLAAVRAKYWPLSGRGLVREIIHKCVTCFKTQPTAIQHIMGDLPAARVQEARPFINSGVDYCGPFQVLDRKARGGHSTKAYVAIFICFATKAVHIELVSDLTTDAFIGALKRFVSRRGKISNIYSDNGTNFVGANRELKILHKMFLAENQNKIADFLSDDNVQWHFIPPRSPHFGGLWEAAVKSAKYHMKRIIGETRLTFEELYTLLTQIEAILNSRPLTPLSNDPNDTSILTPGHFLIGDSLTATVEPDLTNLNVSRLSRWQHLEQLKQHYWKRWSREYLTQMQQRTKWKQQQGRALEPGQLVIVRDDNVPAFKWITGRVEATHQGSDGTVRVATIRTAKDVIRRAATRLCILPIETKTS